LLLEFLEFSVTELNPSVILSNFISMFLPQSKVLSYLLFIG